MIVSEPSRQSRIIELGSIIDQKENEMQRSRAVKDGNWLKIAGEIDILRGELNRLQNGVADSKLFVVTPALTAEVPPPVLIAPLPPPDRISTNGNNTIETPKYIITASQDEVTVKDKATDKFVHVWGDPHIDTSDGDRADFYTKHLTLALDDGSKVTIVPAELAGGVSWSERVVVTNRNEAATISGIHSGHMTIQSSDVNGVVADLMTDDGAVMVQKLGAELDDLTFLDGTEFAGNHANDRNYVDGRANLQLMAGQFYGLPVGALYGAVLGIDPAILYNQISVGVIQTQWTQTVGQAQTVLAIENGRADLKADPPCIAKLLLMLEIALKSGNVDTAFTLLSTVNDKVSTQIANGMIQRVRDLQLQRNDLSAQLAGIRSPEPLPQNATPEQVKQNQAVIDQNGRLMSQINIQLSNISTDVSMLQTFLQEALSDKRQAKEMLSNYKAAEERSESAIVQNFR